MLFKEQPDRQRLPSTQPSDQSIRTTSNNEQQRPKTRESQSLYLPDLPPSLLPHFENQKEKQVPQNNQPLQTQNDIFPTLCERELRVQHPSLVKYLYSVKSRQIKSKSKSQSELDLHIPYLTLPYLTLQVITHTHVRTHTHTHTHARIHARLIPNSKPPQPLHSRYLYILHLVTPRQSLRKKVSRVKERSRGVRDYLAYPILGTSGILPYLTLLTATD